MSDMEPVREEPLCDPPAVLLPVEPVVLPVVDPVAEPVLEEPVLPAPVLEEPLYDPPARLCSVPFTSTRLPTSVEKFDALPVKRYEVPFALIVELLPVDPAPLVLPVALPAVLPVGLAVDPVVPVADPVVDDEEPDPVEASVSM